MINELHKQIEDRIADVKDISFQKGKTGCLLFLYRYGMINPEAKKMADSVLKDVMNEFKTSFWKNYTFTFGSCGIIWAIEYLKENLFVDAETDILFKTVDDRMSSYIVSYPVLLFPDDFPFSPGLYFLKRFRNSQSIMDYYKQTSLIQLIDHCEKILEFEAYRKIGIKSLSGEEMNFLIFFLIQTDKLNIFPYKVKKLLSNIESYIKKANYTNILDTLILSKLLPNYSFQTSELAYPIQELLYKASYQSLFFNSLDIFKLLMNKLKLTNDAVALLFEKKYDSLSLAQWAIIGLSLMNYKT